MLPLKTLFQPSSVTVIGASGNPAKLGHSVLKNLIEGGYEGDLTAVNPSGELILDTPTYVGIGHVPGRVDLAVVVVPAAAVQTVAEECAAGKVKNLLVITAGFGELGADGAAAEKRLAQACEKVGMRLLGPNCLGLIDPIHRLNASFAGAMPAAGSVAVLSQSGAMCTAILDWAKGTNLGFSAFVSVGNKADINESDLLERWQEDSHTTVVVGYLEGISDGPRFISSAGALTRTKPFILIKAGTSDAGAAAVSSHTGALTGSDDVLDAVLTRSGVTRARTIEEVFDFASAFSNLPLPAGNQVAIVTNAGGAGVLTTDEIATHGLVMAHFGEKTESVLRKALPDEANVHNPVDVIGDARAGRYQTALSTVLADDHVDAVIVLLTPQAMTEIPETAEVVIQAAKECGKPILAAFIGGASVAPGLVALRHAGVPSYETPERAVRALAALTRYAEYRRRPRPPASQPSKQTAAAGRILDDVRASGHDAVVVDQALKFLAPYGVTGPVAQHAHSAEEAVRMSREVGFPLVMKIDSPDILHKTDAGGVLLGLADEGAVRCGYDEMVGRITKEIPTARLRGVALIPQIGESHDFIVGGKRDVTFGPVVVVGYGGIYVEVFKDLAFETAPLSTLEATAMIERTKAATLLHGTRGDEPLDIPALAKAIVGVGQALADFPEISELDLNPIRVFPKGALSLDTRIVLH